MVTPAVSRPYPGANTSGGKGGTPGGSEEGRVGPVTLLDADWDAGGGTLRWSRPSTRTEAPQRLQRKRTTRPASFCSLMGYIAEQL